MLSAGSVHSCFTAVASIFCRPNIYCGFAQCQDNVKTRREYWRKKPAGKSPAKMDWFEGVGSKTLATSKWEGKAVPTSVWCQINCVLLRHVFSSSTESLRFDNSTWLVCWWPEQTNPAFHRGSGNTAAAKHWEGSQLQMEPPHGSACAYIKLSWSFQHGFVDKRLEGNLVSSCSSILNASHDSRNIWNKIFYCRWGLNSPVHQWIEKVWLRVSFALYWTLPFFLFCLQARLPSVKNDPFEDQWKGREICRDSLRLHSWMLWNLKLSSGTAEYVTFIYH